MRPAIGFLFVFALACTTGQPAPSASSLLRDSGKAMGGLKTVAADVKFASGKVQLEGFTLDSASTKIKLPGDSDTNFKVKQGDFLVNVRVLTVAGKVYLQLPFSPVQELSAQQAGAIPNLSNLFSEQTGLPAVLASGRSPSLQGSESVDGVDCYKVSTTYTADQVAALLGALRPGGDVAAVFWIGQSDKLVHKATLTGAFDASGANATVEVHLHDFNKAVEITAPVVSPSPAA